MQRRRNLQAAAEPPISPAVLPTAGNSRGEFFFLFVQSSACSLPLNAALVRNTSESSSFRCFRRSAHTAIPPFIPLFGFRRNDSLLRYSFVSDAERVLACGNHSFAQSTFRRDIVISQWLWRELSICSSSLCQIKGKVILLVSDGANKKAVSHGNQLYQLWERVVRSLPTFICPSSDSRRLTCQISCYWQKIKLFDTPISCCEIASRCNPLC
jgi:hypothetical protein